MDRTLSAFTDNDCVNVLIHVTSITTGRIHGCEEDCFAFVSLLSLSRDYLGLRLTLARVLSVVTLLCKCQVVVPFSAAQTKRIEDAVRVAALAHTPIVPAVLRVALVEARARYAATALVLLGLVSV